MVQNHVSVEDVWVQIPSLARSGVLSWRNWHTHMTEAHGVFKPVWVRVPPRAQLGRLAQLAECFAYIEEVGGSRPPAATKAG
jgi:hypothetical protein